MSARNRVFVGALLALASLHAMAQQRAPALQWPDLNGKPQALAQWRGHAVLLNYWATWCGPCRKETPDLQAFSKAQRKVRVLGVALDDADSVKAFLRKSPATYPVLIEDGGAPGSSTQLGNSIGVLPYSVLLDAQGRIVKTKAGPLDAAELQAWLALVE